MDQFHINFHIFAELPKIILYLHLLYYLKLAIIFLNKYLIYNQS